MANDITVPEETTMTPIALLLKAAIERGMDAQGIESLSRVYLEMERRAAEREFNTAFLAFQEDCPRILKNRKVEFTTKKGGGFRAQYAALDDITQLVNPVLRQHGLTVTFDTKIADKAVTVCCTLRHVGGHSQATFFTAPVDPAPALSDAHSTASACSFAERYAYCLALGITAGLPDDDGKAGFTDHGTITVTQAERLHALMVETGSDTPQFWKFCGVATLDEIPARDFARIEQALLQKKRSQK